MALTNNTNAIIIADFERHIANILKSLPIAGHEIARSSLQSIHIMIHNLNRSIEEYDLENIPNCIAKARECANTLNQGRRMIQIPNIVELIKNNTIRELAEHRKRRENVLQQIETLGHNSASELTQLRKKASTDNEIIQAYEAQLALAETNPKAILQGWHKIFCGNLSQAITGIEVCLRAKQKQEANLMVAASAHKPGTSQKKK